MTPRIDSTCTICGGRLYLLERRGDLAGARVCPCSSDCKHCGGLGHVFLQKESAFSERAGKRTYEVLAPCSCQLLKMRIERYSQAAIPGVLADASFDNYTPANEAQDRARKVAAEFAMTYVRATPSRGFILSGPVGTGKTHLVAAALSHLIMEVGASASYVEISLLYARIRAGFNEGKSGGEIIGPLSEVEILAIDELGKGRGSPFEMETLDELIARRYNAGRTTLFGTNYSLEPERKAPRAATPGHRTSEELKQSARDAELLRERVGERIYSRLCEMCEFVEMPAGTPDKRRMRHEHDSRARPGRILSRPS